MKRIIIMTMLLLIVLGVAACSLPAADDPCAWQFLEDSDYSQSPYTKDNSTQGTDWRYIQEE